MRLNLPDRDGNSRPYRMVGRPATVVKPEPGSSRIILAAAHVVANPFSPSDPSVEAELDWEATLAFRRHLDGLGLGIAEAMDTAQRGAGLDWANALELIRRTRDDLPNANAFNGAGTDHLGPGDASNLDDVRDAYLHQIEAIQLAGGRIIVMASRELARLANGPVDYLNLYDDVLAACERPAILHWLGEMFDPALEGYWGSASFETARDTLLSIIESNVTRVDGIKVSLLDKHKEIAMRRRLPDGVRMYTGDDFNYPELIAGDDHGYSDALLGIFDPLAEAAAHAVARLDTGDVEGFRAILDPTIPLARHIFCPPTRHYKTGVVFLAWLNGFQDHFVMVGGAQSMRPIHYFVDCFRMADKVGLLRDPEMAAARMKRLLALYGV